jgi:hypothetical protein
MRTQFTQRLAIVLALILLLPLGLYAQTDRKAMERKKLETNRNTARTKVEHSRRMVEVSDSLTTTGIQMVNDAKADLKSVETDRKKVDKEYAANEKLLLKQSNSKDKAEADKAKAELKKLDTQYKADAKALATREKDANKKWTTGESNMARGKASKKTAEDALKTSQQALDAAEASYNAASGEDKGNETEKEKK